MGGDMMDDFDQALIQALTLNARSSVTELAARLGVARSTVQTRLARLEDRGVIAGFTLRLGTQARPQIRATVLLQVQPRALPQLIARLTAMPEVERAHSSSGRFDLILQVATATTADLDAALDKIGALSGVNGSESLIHLSTKIDRGA